MKPRDFEQQLQDAFDGELDGIRAHALREELRANPHAVDLYCDHAILDTELRRHAANRCKVPGAISARNAVASAVQRRRQVMVSLMSAAAVILLTAVVLGVVLVPPNRALAGLEVSPGSSLSGGDGSRIRSSSLKRGQAVKLGQGVAKLTFDSGVDAVIEGPATFKLLADNRLELKSGHSWFHVPGKARGFTVVSPQLEVVDLGTEFGIDLREDLRPQVHVLKGRVETKALTGNRRKQELHAGQSATLSSNGRWSLAAADFHKFRNRLPRSLPVLKMDFENIDGAMLAIDGDMIGAEVANARLIRPKHARLVPGIAGKALELDGNGACIETTWPGISGSAPRTLSLWCRIPEGTGFLTAPPLAWWGNPAQGWNRKFKVALFTQPDGRTTLRASFGELLFDGTAGLADGAWHHLAVVYQGNDPDGYPNLRFYIDGRPDAISQAPPTTSRIETDIRSESSGRMGIGEYELPAGDRNPFLKATLDEFRVFAGALDDDEVRELAGAR